MLDKLFESNTDLIRIMGGESDAGATAASQSDPTPSAPLTLFKKLPMMVAALDPLDRMLVWNSKCEAVTGYTKGEMIGSFNAFERLYPDRTYRQDILNGWQEHRFDFCDWETWITCKSGEKRQVIWSGFSEGLPFSTLKSVIIGADPPAHHKGHQKENRQTEDDPEIAALLERNREIETMLTELLETNRALSELARNIDKEKEKSEKKMTRLIKLGILPILQDLSSCTHLEEYRANVDKLRNHITQLSASLMTVSSTIYSLSTAESQVATLIGCGFTSQEIADKLFISLNTVKTHRRNIRKKLHIKNTMVNLSSYLKHKLLFPSDM